MGSLLTAISLHSETCPFLVCHRRSWLLHQPRAGPKDGPVGQVSVPCTSATTHKSRVILVFVVLGALPQGQAWAVLSQIPAPLPAVFSACILPTSALARGRDIVYFLSWSPGWQGLVCSLASLLSSASANSSCSGGHFMSTAERIRLPDDCTIGYIVEALLGVPLIRSGLFHSHLENLQQVPTTELHEQVRMCPPGLGGQAGNSRVEGQKGEGASKEGTIFIYLFRCLLVYFSFLRQGFSV